MISGTLILIRYFSLLSLAISVCCNQVWGGMSVIDCYELLVSQLTLLNYFRTLVMSRQQKPDLQIKEWVEFSSETLTPVAFNCPVVKGHENDLDVCSIAVAQETPNFSGN